MIFFPHIFVSYEVQNSKNWENFQYVPHLKFNFNMKFGIRNYPGSKKSTQARPIISTTLIGGFSTQWELSETNADTVNGSLKLSAFMLCYVAMYVLKSIKLHEISLLKLRQHSCLYKSSLICTWRHYSRQVCMSG